MTALRFRSLRSPALWSLMGDILPMLAAMAVAPALLQTLGVERLGVLSLIWVFVGYFSFLDLGLGRAVTVAVASARHDRTEAGSTALRITGSAVVALLVLGAAGAMGLGLVAQWGTLPLQLSSRALEAEVRTALLWMAPSLPLLLASSALRGHLEGVGAFRALNLIRIPAGTMLAAGPFVAAQFTPDLAWATISLLGVRVAQLVALAAVLAHHQQLPVTRLAARLLSACDWPQLRRLLSFGGWMTVSSVLGPVIVYADRFVIGLLVGASAVSLYAIPFDVVSRFPVLIASACSVLLPELVRVSVQVAQGQVTATEWRSVLRRATGIAGGLVLAGTGIGWWLLPDFMVWWMGAAFAADATLVAQVLLIAFAINALAQIPYTGLLALGQTRTIATIHLLECLPCLACLWWAVSHHGLLGAAWVCVARGLVDYGLLALACHRGGRHLATRHTP